MNYINRKVPKKMKVYKNEKGVTLIALVITITILALLFSAVLSELLGNSGFISQMRQTKADEEISQSYDQTRINSIMEKSEDTQESDGATGMGSEPYLGTMTINANVTNNNSSGFQKRDISINVSITDVYNAKISKIAYAIKLSSNENYSAEEYDPLNLTSLKYTFSGMDPRSTYSIKVTVYYEDINDTLTGETSVYTN